MPESQPTNLVSRFETYLQNKRDALQRAQEQVSTLTAQVNELEKLQNETPSAKRGPGRPSNANNTAPKQNTTVRAPRRHMSPTVRKHLSEVMKQRWADKRRSAGKAPKGRYQKTSR